jgi:coupling of ubiquitin conjugation to ER degradation protein 1
MGEVLNVIVAFAVIVFAVRWATKGSPHTSSSHLLILTLALGKEQPNSPGVVLGFRPKNVTDEMVRTF